MSFNFFSCTPEKEANKEDKKDTISVLKDEILNKFDIVYTLEAQMSKSRLNKNIKFICPLGGKEVNSYQNRIFPICEMKLIENLNYTK